MAQKPKSKSLGTKATRDEQELSRESDILFALSQDGTPETLSQNLPRILKHLESHNIPRLDNFHRTARFSEMGLSSLTAIIRWAGVSTDLAPVYVTLKRVWPDIHNWIIFFLSFPFESSARGAARSTICSAIAFFALLNGEMRDLIASTPGVITSLTHVWLDEINNVPTKVTIGSPFPISASAALQKFTHRPKPEWIEEMISAAGGLPQKFACLALDSVRARINDSTTLDFDALASDLEIVTDLWRGMTRMDNLVEEALSSGGNQTITDVMTCPLLYNGPDFAKAANCLAICVDYFDLGLKNIAGSSWACIMLKAPILLSILQAVRWSYHHDKGLAGVLENMTPYLVYRSVLRQAEKAIERIDELGPQGTIVADTQVSQRMMRYCELAGQHLKICSARCARTLMQICGNEACARTGRPREFLRCSGCQITNYCNQDCQRQSWKFGDHRKMCKLLSAGMFTENTKRALSPQDFRGLVAIMQHNMTACHDRVTKMRVSSDRIFVAVFDYRVDPPRIMMEPSTKDVLLQGDDLDPLLKYNPSRRSLVERPSQGRMHVNARAILPFGKELFVYEGLAFEVNDDGQA